METKYTHQKLAMYRTYLILIATVYPIWGIFLKYANLNIDFPENVWLRFIVCFPGLIFFIASYYSNKVKININKFYTLAYFILFVYHDFATDQVNLSPIMVSGHVLLLLIYNFTCESIKSFAFMNITIILLSMIGSNENLLFPRLVFVMELITFSAITFIVFKRNIDNQEILEEERKNFLGLFTRAPFAILFVKDDGTLSNFNKQARRICGLDYSDRGKKISDVMQIKWLHETNLNKTSKYRLSQLNEAEITTKDKTFPASIKLALLSNKNEDISCFFIEDRSEEIELKEKIEKERVSNIHAAKMSSLGEMAAGIAHEVNNPLTVISVLLDKIEILHSRGDLSKDNLKENFEKVHSNIGKISKIIKTLKNLTRSAEDEPKKPISLNDLLSDIIDFAHQRMTKSGVDFTIDLCDDVTINCREVEVQQVIVNLLNNAVDAVDDTDERRVSLKTRESSGKIEIEVSDSGHGIPVEKRKEIFQPFFTTKKVGKGTGLGLSISKQIIEGHGGKLTLSPPGERTTFKITLPLS